MQLKAIHRMGIARFIIVFILLMNFTSSACRNSNQDKTIESGDSTNIRTPEINATTTGIIRQYYEDGALKSETEYLNGIENGKSIQYYPSGQIQSAAMYKDGKLYGEVIRYFKNGQKSSLSNFNIKGIAPMKIWYESGQIRQEGNVVDDKMDGRWNQYFKSGNLSSIENYKMNTKDGVWLYFSDNGDTVRRKLYKNDSLIQIK